MTVTQRFLLTILPDRWGQRMKAASEEWRIRCATCDKSRTLWDAGGIRWGKFAVGSVTRTFVRCSRCRGLRAGVIEKAPKNTSPLPTAEAAAS